METVEVNKENHERALKYGNEEIDEKMGRKMKGVQ